MTRIECVPDSGAYTRRFRGAVIEAEAAGGSYEVVLTAAHGLPADADALLRSCSVVGAEDARYRIAGVWRSSSRGRGSVDDWAVLLTARRLSGRVNRLRTLPVDVAARRQMAEMEVPVRLPLRFVGGERACHMIEPELSSVELAVELFGHTCRAWSGHSGSPILTTVEGEVYILGIHLGSRWIVEKHASLEIGRYLDAKILEAIHSATMRGRGGARSE